jgi:hypothetical protein
VTRFAFVEAELWVADVTYAPTVQGWLYLPCLTDVFSRMTLGWSTRTACSRACSDRLAVRARSRLDLRSSRGRWLRWGEACADGAPRASETETTRAPSPARRVISGRDLLELCD